MRSSHHATTTMDSLGEELEARFLREVAGYESIRPDIDPERAIDQVLEQAELPVGWDETTDLQPWIRNRRRAAPRRLRRRSAGAREVLAG